MPMTDIASVVQEVNDNWRFLKNKHLVITGATGFIGKWLLETVLHANGLLHLNLSITIVTRKPEHFVTQFPNLASIDGLQVIGADLTSDFIDKIKPFDYLIHAATDVQSNASETEIFRQIILATQNVVSLIKKSGYPCKVLLLSSGAVYGKAVSAGQRFKEEQPLLAPQFMNGSGYQQGKLVSEQLWLQSANDLVEVSIARCFCFLGPYNPLTSQHAIGNFLHNILNGQDIEITGNGEALRSYQYISDLCIWLWSIILRGENRSIFNVGGYDAVSIKELAETVAKITNSQAKINVRGAGMKSQTIESYLPELQKAEDTLGLENTIGLNEAIKKTYDWFAHTKIR